ncbi:MAG: autotransporter-associated beta strand repeat-containing protein [Kiritimatiellae bacterium]|nr:autotransporter-associated beta strand repeat-containing protein [Kiritimatiellia bacterium]
MKLRKNIAFRGERKLALVRTGTAFLGALLLPWTAGKVFAESADGFNWASAWWMPVSSFPVDAHYWDGNVLPAGNGVGYFLGVQSANLTFSTAATLRGLDFGNVKVYVNNGRKYPSISGSGLTLTGDAFISGTGSGDIATVDGVVHGTGANTFTKKGAGNLTVNAKCADFGTIAAGGGALITTNTGALYASGAPAFAVRGGAFRWAPSLPAGGTGTASLGATTYGIGSGSIRWTKGSGNLATLTLASLASEGNGSTLCVHNEGGLASLGDTERLFVTTPPALVNGMLDPGIVTRDTSVESWPFRFTTYDAEKGLVPYPTNQMVNLAVATETDVAVVTATNTLETSKRVAALVVENSALLSLSNGVTLAVGDDNAAHAAGVIFNLQNPMGGDTPLDFAGDGTLDFGASPGVFWMSSPTMSGWGGNRRLILKTKITGSNGVTFASRHRGDVSQSAGMMTLLGTGLCEWNGPTRIAGVIFWLEGANLLPAGDVYVTEGSGWDGQFRVGSGGWTFNQNFFLSGKGPNNDVYGVFYLPNGYTTLGGVITLLDDASFTCASSGTGGVIFRQGVRGPGSLYVGAGGTFNFHGTNTFDKLVVSGPTTVNVYSNATLGAGLVWYRSSAHTLAFGRRPDTLAVTNAFRVESAATLAVKLDNAKVAFTKGVPFTSAKLGNFSSLAVGGVTSVGALRGVGARDTTLGNFGQDQVTASVPGAELRVGAATNDVLALPLADGAGTLALTKTGAGTLELPPASRTYSGATTVREGTLKLNANPLESGSLLYWMDASRAEDFEKDATTGAITKWNSRGGSANVSFSTIEGSPTWGTAAKVNGLDVVTTKKTSAADRLRANVALEQRTVFIVYRAKAIVNLAGLFGGNDFYNDYGVRVNGDSPTSSWDANSSHYCYNTTGWIRRDGANGGQVQTGVPHILTLVHDRDDWPPSVTWGANTYGCTFKADLGYYQSAARNYDGDYCEVIAFDRVLTESEMRVVENYLSEKWLAKTLWSDLAMPAHLPAATALTVATGATLDLNGNSVTVASLEGNGIVTNSSDVAATLTVTGGGSFGGRVGGKTTITTAGAFTTGTDLLMPSTTGLAYWCDASRRDTILLNASGNVTSWVCRAASTAQALHNTGTLTSGGSSQSRTCPTYSADGLGGRPCINFATSAQKALWADVNSPVRTVFIVAEANGSQTGNCAGLWGIGCLEMGFRFSNNSTSIESGGSYVRPTDANDWVHMDGVSYGNNSLPMGDKVPRVISFRFEAAHHTAAYMADVLGLGTENPSRNTLIGCYTGNPAFVGYVGEVIAYDRELGDDEMRRVENYLYRKWKTLSWTEGNPPPEAEDGSVFADGTLALAAGGSVTVAGGLTVGTLSGGGSVAGDLTVTDGFDVTVKPDGTTDTLAVDGDVTLGPDAYLRVYNPGNLQNGVFGTFLSATSITGTFAGSNLEKPNAWRVTANEAKVYRFEGTVLFIK